MRVLDLFSGIGGFSLGLERAGMSTVAFCEIEPYCQRVLAKHWPEVPIYDDIRELTADALRRDGIAVDVICGGFPCQDISDAGNGAGLDGDRSRLWSEIARLVRELRPRYVIVENVAALLHRGIDRVLGDLAGIGYDAEWSTISACALGHAHMRRRLWLVAYANGQHGRQGIWNTFARSCGQIQAQHSFEDTRAGQSARLAHPSTLYRGANDVPRSMDRNRALGNAVVPQIPELIGRAIMESAYQPEQPQQVAS